MTRIRSSLGAAVVLAPAPPAPDWAHQGIAVPVSDPSAEKPHLGRLWRVPDLPKHYLPRSEIAALTAALLRKQPGTVGITGLGRGADKHSIYGMGGLGKSVLAAALCRQPAIRARYPDGIFWLAVGQTPEIRKLQADLAREFGDITPVDNATDGRQRLRDLVAAKAVLLVLDDVWDVAHVDKLEVIDERGCILITTRDRTVLQRGEEHCLDVLPHSQALALLGHWVGQEATSLPEDAAEVAKKCGRLPLALATIGAMVRADQITWADAGELLDNADLGDLEVRFPDYPYRSILAAIEVSVAAMDERLRARYLDLAIFPEDEPIPEAALEILWSQHEQGLAGAKLRLLLGKLTARSLATRNREGSVRLHDLQRRYLQNRADGLPYRHGQLVDAYAARCPAGFGFGIDDGYFFQRLPWHLAQARRPAQLADLLFDYDWLDAKLRATSVTELVADFELLLARHSAYPDAALVRDALCLSSHVIARDPEQLAGQLIGRLGHFERAPTEPLAYLLAHSRGPHAHAWFEPLVPSLIPPGGSLLRTLSGHADDVMAVAITADGQRAISASRDKTLKVWDLGSGQQLHTLAGHEQGVNAVAVTGDGTRIISASADKTLKVWDLDSGRPLRTLAGHERGVNAVAVTGDGTRIISASADKTLKVWDLDSGDQLRTLAGHEDWVNAVAVTADGTHAISAAKDTTLKVWDLDSGHQLRTLAGHAWEVTAVAVTMDGKRAISASADKTLKVWDLDSGDTLRTLVGHAWGVNAVALSKNDKRAISAAADSTLEVWDLDNGQTLRTLSGHAAGVSAVAVTEDGQWAISASYDKTLKLWGLDSDPQLRTPYSHAAEITAVAVTADGTRAISAAEDKTLKMWDPDSGHVVRPFSGHTAGITAIAVTADGKRAISAAKDTTLMVWDLDSGQVLRTLSGHAGRVTTVTVTGDGKRAVSAADDRTVKVWDLDSGRALRTLSGHMAAITAVAVTTDGKRAISAADDKTLRVWDLDSGRALRTLSSRAIRVSAVTVIGDRKCVISTSSDKTLAVWDLDSDQVLRLRSGHLGSGGAVAVTADGKRAVSAAADGTLTVWCLDSAQALRTLSGHADWVGAVATTGDGKRIISTARDETLQVWDIDSGACLATFTGEARLVVCATSPSANLVVVGDAIGHIHLLRLVKAGKRKGIIRSPDLTADNVLEHPAYEPSRVLNQRQCDQLVQLLEACLGLRDPHTRSALIERLPHAIRVRIAYAPTTRIHLGNIVNTCAAFPAGLADLAATVRWIEGETSIAVQSLDAFLDQLGIQPNPP